MKKLIYMLVMASMTAAPTQAQLRVNKNGQMVIGKTTSEQTMMRKVSSTDTVCNETDSLASLVILGRGAGGSGAYVSFGSSAVTVGEGTSNSEAGIAGRLMLRGTEGLAYTDGTSEVFSYSGEESAFSFTCPVSAAGFVVTQPAEERGAACPVKGVNPIAMLTPVSYTQHVAQAKPGKGGITSGTQNRSTYGFDMESFRKALPGLVVENGDGTVGVDYMALIPLLVSEVNDLRAKVEGYEAALNEISGNREAAGVGMTGVVKASLSQNRPNPFRTTTAIECVVPEEAGSAAVCLYDLNGRQIARYDVAERGATTVSVKGDTLSPGMYLYTLVVDGTEIDCRRMVITD